MQLRHNHLRSRGWTESELHRTEAGLARAAAKKHPAYKWLEKAVFWGLLSLCAIATLIVSITLAPLLQFFAASFVGLLFCILGVSFGLLLRVTMTDIDWLTHHHHGFALGFLMMMAMIVVTLTINALSPGAPALLIGAAFTFCLVAPYGAHVMQRLRRRAHG